MADDRKIPPKAAALVVNEDLTAYVQPPENADPNNPPTHEAVLHWAWEVVLRTWTARGID